MVGLPSDIAGPLPDPVKARVAGLFAATVQKVQPPNGMAFDREQVTNLLLIEVLSALHSIDIRLDLLGRILSGRKVPT